MQTNTAKSQNLSWKIVVGLCVSIDYIITRESLEIRLMAKYELMEHTKHIVKNNLQLISHFTHICQIWKEKMA